jgi:Family of unknown function (DUF5681)
LKLNNNLAHCGDSVPPANRKNSGKERTQFKPGQSGNPSGRPKSSSEFRKVVEAYLQSKLDPKSTVLQDVFDRLRKDKPEVLLHYAYGKPIEQIDVHSDSPVLGLPAEYLAILRDHAKKR